MGKWQLDTKITRALDQKCIAFYILKYSHPSLWNCYVNILYYYMPSLGKKTLQILDKSTYFGSKIYVSPHFRFKSRGI